MAVSEPGMCAHHSICRFSDTSRTDAASMPTGDPLTSHWRRLRTLPFFHGLASHLTRIFFPIAPPSRGPLLISQAIDGPRSGGVRHRSGGGAGAVRLGHWHARRRRVWPLAGSLRDRIRQSLRAPDVIAGRAPGAAVGAAHGSRAACACYCDRGWYGCHGTRRRWKSLTGPYPNTTAEKPHVPLAAIISGHTRIFGLRNLSLFASLYPRITTRPYAAA